MSALQPAAAAAGFEPILVAARRPRAAARALVPALAVPDFDAPDPPPAPDPAPAADPAAERAAALEAARAAGFAEGEAAGRQAMLEDAAAREAAVLERVAAALEGAAGGAAEAAGEAAGEAALALARLLLAALDAALPEAAARLAPEAAARLAAELRPLLDQGVAVTLYLPPGCALDARVRHPGLVLEEDAGLAPGDARAAWRGGGGAVSLAARRQAVAALLEAFELQER